MVDGKAGEWPNYNTSIQDNLTTERLPEESKGGEMYGVQLGTRNAILVTFRALLLSSLQSVTVSGGY
eukprot:CAMPEP_0177766924 /NCGR_PEP_ID=MMETSP0491_2-20121128/8787_1 /TAXON_ID=63592 /ORGANISM="Tetraselmis chuii, Strain PLY429" /LENGTH=66 /DNA_ID=CAMNT_0019283377 /DNA_START=44 /DNA_END=241 /DNA_ORIENTATION=+